MKIRTTLKYFAFYTIMLTSVITINAQNTPSNKPNSTGNSAIGVIKGEVEDSLTGDPVEYGNIVLFRVKDSSMTTGTITNEKGQFVLTKVPFGKYYMVVSFIGYKNIKIQNIFIKPQASELDLGLIKLEPSTNNLSTVNITGEKK